MSGSATLPSNSISRKCTHSDTSSSSSNSNSDHESFRKTPAVAQSDILTTGSGDGLNNESQCTLSLRNYSFSVSTKKMGEKRILHDISFDNNPGQLLAIMGPSGSGKTTLLNGIARRVHGNEEGSILFNGNSMEKSELQSNRLLSYVMTQDYHLSFLTVHETLMYTARLKLPHELKTDHLSRCEALIQALSLQACRDTAIGGQWHKGLSSGELRRLSIAVELMDNPEILLLDEPTTGLDSQRAANLIPVLKQLALTTRKNLVMTIHQPSSSVFNNFDNALFLAQGRIIYWGPAASCMSYINTRLLSLGRLPYTKHCNPADFLLDFISPKPTRNDSDSAYSSGSQVARRSSSSNSETSTDIPAIPEETYKLTNEELIEWNNFIQSKILSALPKPSVMPIQKRVIQHSYMGKRWTDFRVLYERSSLNSIRNPMETIVLAFFTSVLGLLLGLLFFDFAKEPTAGDSVPIGKLMDLVDWIIEDTHPMESAWAYEYNPIGIDGSPLPTSPPFSDYGNNTTVTGDNITSFVIVTDASGDPVVDDREPVTEWVESQAPPVSYTYDTNNSPVNMPSDVASGLAATECFRLNLLNTTPELGWNELFDIETRYTSWNMPVNTSIEDPDLQIELDNARDVMTLGYRLFAIMDIFQTKVDRSDLPSYDLWDASGAWIDTSNTGVKNVVPTDVIGLQYWMKLMACYGEELNSLLACFNFPKLPDIRDLGLLAGVGMDVNCSNRYTPIATTLPPEAVKRALDAHKEFSNYFNQGVARSLTSIIREETGGTSYIAGTATSLLNIANAILDCDHDSCKEINEFLTEVTGDAGGYLIPVVKSLSAGGVIFFLGAQAIFASFDAILSFQQERVLFNRETNNYLYSPSSFFFAKMLATLPFNYLHTTVLFVIFYFLCGFDSEHFGAIFGINCCTLWASYGFNYMFASFSKNLQLSVVLVPLTIVVMMVTSGFFIRESNFPLVLGWMKYFSISRWAFHASVLEYFPPDTTWGGIPTNLARTLLGTTTTDMSVCVSWLIGMGFFFRGCMFIGMKFFHRSVGLES